MEYQPALEPFEEPDLFSDRGEEDRDELEETIEDPEDVLGELFPLVQEHFDVWWLGSEAEWAAYTFRILRKAGLVGDEPGLEHTRSVARLMVLAALNKEFANHSGEYTDWRDTTAYWVGEYPLADPFALGYLCAELGADSWNDPTVHVPPSVDPEICRDVITSMHQEVVDALVEELGDNGLFASLWHARLDDTTYPLSGEQVYDACNDVTVDKMTAWQWVAEGCPL